jgi:hypothetical protein
MLSASADSALRILIWSTLVRLHAVDGVVAGQRNSHDRAHSEANNRTNPSHSTFTNHINAVVPRAGGFRRCADPGSYTGADRAANEGIAQVVFVFREFHPANILPRDGLSPCSVLVHNRGFGETHKRSGMPFRVRFDDLNLLPRTQNAQIRPGRFVALRPRRAGDGKDADQEQGFSHERHLLSEIFFLNLRECSFALDGTPLKR